MGKRTIKNTIRTLRFFRNEMTQEQLAELVGVTRQTIIAMEKGKYSPSLELAFRIALAFEVPRAPWLAIAFPLTVGYGGFGFYLHGDDRNTPDGRRVSEWENELFDGRDSHLGVVIDAGIRLMAVLPRTPWLRPYVAVNVTLVPGFDTMVTDHYSGLSGSIGMEVGLGL